MNKIIISIFVFIATLSTPLLAKPKVVNLDYKEANKVFKRPKEFFGKKVIINSKNGGSFFRASFMQSELSSKFAQVYSISASNTNWQTENLVFNTNSVIPKDMYEKYMDYGWDELDKELGPDVETGLSEMRVYVMSLKKFNKHFGQGSAVSWAGGGKYVCIVYSMTLSNGIMIKSKKIR